MRVLVSGCAGFIGTHFVRYLLDTHADWHIIGVDALTYAANLTELTKTRENARFAFYHADIADREAMREIFERERPEMVVNLAAESHVDRSIEASELFIRTNVLGTGVLLDLSLAYGVLRFHQVSTDEVYGDLPPESTECFTEDSPLRPSSPYSASKAAADLLVLSYHRTHGLAVTISRSSNNYGAYQHHEKLIPLTVACALRGESIPVYGTGENRRDWLHVLDHCRAIDLILTRGRAGEIYNIATGKEIPNLALVRHILSLLGKSESLIRFVPDRPGHDCRYPIDTTKILHELGFEARIPFDEGFAGTVKFYQNTIVL